jgi:phage terminase large subunit-like protein
MVEWTPALARRAKVIRSTKRIWVPETASFSRVLSADVPNKHGINLSGAAIDELHAHPNRDLYDILSEEGGAGAAREQPLWFIISTAGYDRNSICWELHERVRQKNAGIIDDPTLYGVIYGVPEDANWEDEREWAKANPSLDQIFGIDDLRTAYQKAKGSPVKENLFRRLRLNQWTASEVRWMDMKHWNACGGQLPDLKGRQCYAGLDLARKTDLTALSLVFPIDGEYFALLHYWMPAEGINDKEKRDKVPYQLWAEQGWLTLTPGNVTDYRYIRDTLAEYRKLYNILEVAFDPWGAILIAGDLTSDGFTMVECRQGFKTMSPPTKELECLVLEGKFHHGDNPVLRWNVDNTVLVIDKVENVQPDKSKSTQRIDGVVATIMALDRALRHGSGVSIYESQGIDIL